MGHIYAWFWVICRKTYFSWSSFHSNPLTWRSALRLRWCIRNMSMCPSMKSGSLRLSSSRSRRLLNIVCKAMAQKCIWDEKCRQLVTFDLWPLAWHPHFHIMFKTPCCQIIEGAHNHCINARLSKKSITKLIPISHMNLSNYSRIIMRYLPNLLCYECVGIISWHFEPKTRPW